MVSHFGHDFCPVRAPMSLRHGVPKNLPLVVRLPVCHGSQVTNHKSLTPLECALTRRPQLIENTATLSSLETPLNANRRRTPFKIPITKKPGGGGVLVFSPTLGGLFPPALFFPESLF